MTLPDLTRAMTDLGWKYQDATLQSVIYEEVKYLKLSYEEILQVCKEAKTAPSPGNLIKYIKDLVYTDSSPCVYEVITLDADEEYYKAALETSRNYHFINPVLIVCIDNLERYLSRVEFRLSRAAYEIAWVWLFFKDYPHTLNAPEKVTLPELWKTYGIEG